MDDSSYQLSRCIGTYNSMYRVNRCVLDR